MRESNNRPAPGLRALAALAAVLCLGLAAWAGTQGLGRLYAENGFVVISPWGMHPELSNPEPEQWAKVESVLQTAAALDPFAPDADIHLGQLHEWRLIESPVGDPAARASRLQALEHYLAALRLRPSDPARWASVALLRARLGDTDTALAEAIDRALLLGPDESAVQQRMAIVGQSYEQLLSEGALTRLERAFRLGVEQGYLPETLVLNLAEQGGPALIGRLPP